MRHLLDRSWSRTLAMVLIASTASAVSAQAGEFIVGQEVVSDTAVGGGSSYVGDLSENEIGLGGFEGDTSGGAGAASAGCIGRGYGQPDLFYNYYTQGYCNTSNAQMYISPLPVPPNVGHTFYTYQPFYPHHMLYWHKDRYHRYYDNGRGMNRTRALYYAPPVKTALSNFYWNKIRLAR